MPNLSPTRCSTCSAPLLPSEDQSLIHCSYCCNRYFIHIDKGRPVFDTKPDKTAAELAIVRLGKEIYDLEEWRSVVEKKSDNDWVGGFGWIKFLFWIGLIAYTIAIIPKGTYTNDTILLLIGFTALPISIFLYLRRKVRVEQLRRERMDEINDRLLTKNAQMDHNRWIVEN